MASDPSTSSSTNAGRTSARRRSNKAADGTPPQQNQAQGNGQEETAPELNFREAQTALELSLAELQSADLDIERMTGLYNRARAYADRCDALLRQVEQEVLQWDPQQPENPPQPYTG